MLEMGAPKNELAPCLMEMRDRTQMLTGARTYLNKGLRLSVKKYGKVRAPGSGEPSVAENICKRGENSITCGCRVNTISAKYFKTIKSWFARNL